LIPKILIAVGIALSPFIFSNSGMDSRLPKEMFCVTIALSIVLFCIYHGTLKPFKNKWFLILIWFVLLSIHCAPVLWEFSMAYHRTPQSIEIFRNFVISEWHYKPLAYSLIYGFLLISIASIDFSLKEIKTGVFLMGLAGFIMSLYVLLQQIGGLDQFFKIADVSQNARINDVTKPLLFGTLGNSTIVSAFIAMTMPLVFFLRKWLMLPFMVAAVLFTESKMAIGSMAISCLVYIFWRYRPSLILSTIFFLLLSFSTYQYLDKQGGAIPYFMSHQSQRVETWVGAFEELKSQQDRSGRPFTITGLGPGSYRNVYVTKSNSIYDQAHNDPFELFICLGIAGFGIFLMSIWNLILRIYGLCRSVWDDGRGIIIAMSCSFLCIAIDSLGSFPFQIHPILLYTIILVGFIYNPFLEKEF